MLQDYLCHYGVKGMRWGVRKNKKKYGMSKGQVRRADKNIGSNQREVALKYEKTLRSNKKRNTLLKQQKEVSSKINKEESRLISKHNGYDFVYPDNVKKLYKQRDSLEAQSNEIKRKIGESYVNEFNDAKLKDIGYSGSKELGYEMLKKYGKLYYVRRDGIIEESGGWSRGVHPSVVY